MCVDGGVWCFPVSLVLNRGWGRDLDSSVMCYSDSVNLQDIFRLDLGQLCCCLMSLKHFIRMLLFCYCHLPIEAFLADTLSCLLCYLA